jgi:hypothetical protein
MTEMIRVHCDVKFADEDIAKSLGAMWNMEDKSWYFQYRIGAFFNDDSLNTFHYKPIRVDLCFSHEFIKRTYTDEDELRDYLYRVSKSRYNEYMEK